MKRNANFLRGPYTTVPCRLSNYEATLSGDAMHNRRRAVFVCQFVCPSVTFVMYSVETNKRIFKIFSPSASHTILVFPYQTLLFTGDDDEVFYDKKHRRYVENNRTEFNCTH